MITRIRGNLPHYHPIQKITYMLSKKLRQGILSAFIRVIRVIRDSETKIRVIHILRDSKTKPATQKQTQIQTNNP